MLYVSLDVDVSEELIVSQGQKLVKEEPSLVYVSVAPRGNSTRLICFVGPKAREAWRRSGRASERAREGRRAARGEAPRSSPREAARSLIELDAAKDLLTKAITGAIGR